MLYIIDSIVVLSAIALLVLLIIFIIKVSKKQKGGLKIAVCIGLCALLLALSYKADRIYWTYDSAVYAFRTGDYDKAKIDFQKIEYLPIAGDVLGLIEAFEANDGIAIQKSILDLDAEGTGWLTQGTDRLIAEKIMSADNADLAFYLTANYSLNVESYLKSINGGLFELRNVNDFKVGNSPNGKAALYSIETMPDAGAVEYWEMGLQTLLPDKYKPSDAESIEYIITFEKEYIFKGFYAEGSSKGYQVALTGTLKRVNSDDAISTKDWLGKEPPASISDYIKIGVIEPGPEIYEQIIGELLSAVHD